jgi:SAM-dependent methyltransferase
VEKAYELQTHRAEERHWWYRGRRLLIHRVIAGIGLPAHARILDAGCGSGRNMVELVRYGTVAGVEVSPESVRVARERGVGEVVQGSIDEMPFADASFDLAVCLDVIEHLDDDRAALVELRRVVARGGALLVTVPAYPWLWSAHDEVNQHRRRYTKRSLLHAAESAGWRTQRVTYFNSLLLPIAIATRALERVRPATADTSRDLWIPPAALNRMLEQPLHLEAAILGRDGRALPAGLSLLAVLK